MICSKCGQGRAPGKLCRPCVKKWHAEHYRKPEIKARHAAQGRAWRKANPEKNRRYDLKAQLKKLGVTLDDYQQVFDAQAGTCAICRSAEPGRKNGMRLLVDHDHDTGRFRGLLCHPCNAAIGMLKDNAELVDKAAAYLRERKGLTAGHGSEKLRS